MAESDAWQCPRCGLMGHGDWLDFVALAKSGELRCAFCVENGRRFTEGKGALPEPTAEFPTATGRGMASDG